MNIPKLSSRTLPSGKVQYYCKINYRQVVLGSDLKVAQRELVRLAMQHAGNQAPIDGASPRFHTLAYEWLNWIRMNRKPNTYDQHLRVMTMFLETIPIDTRVDEIKRHHVLDWVESVPGWSNGGRTQGICTVHACLSWACKRDKITYNPIAEIERPEKGHRETIVTDEQKQLILASITDKAFRDFFVFCVEQGVRPHEARTVQASQIDLVGGMIVFARDEHKTGDKTRKSRLIYLTPTSINLLRSLVAKWTTGPVFRDERGQPWTRHTIHRRFRKLRTLHKDALPKDLSSYVLRHTYVTEALAAGISDTVIAELVGHADPTMIQRVYGHMRKKTAAMKDVAARLSVVRSDGTRQTAG